MPITSDSLAWDQGARVARILGEVKEQTTDHKPQAWPKRAKTRPKLSVLPVVQIPGWASNSHQTEIASGLVLLGKESTITERIKLTV